MSSWQYAFLFPQSPMQLHPANGVQHLTEFGAEFDESITLCVPIDKDGHWLDVGEEVALKAPFESDLVRYLEMGMSFSIQLRSAHIVISVHFLLESPNPHIAIGWSRRFLREAPATMQSQFWRAIRAFAKDCNAAYVIIVDDAEDLFEDRFVDVDGKRVLDVEVKHRYGLSLREMWIQKSLGSTLPDGPEYGDCEDIGEGFECHAILTL